MQAVILAGGKGTRLRPYTTSLPKPLVPLGDHPILEILLRQLSAQGFKDVILSTGHLAELIEAYCGNGKKWGVKIRYAREEKPLSTAGGLRLIKGLKNNFLVVNGDVLTDMNFKSLYDFHRKNNAWATIGVVARESKVDYGVIEIGPRDALAKYIEKPTLPYLVSMGANVFDRRAVGAIKRGEPLGIPDLVLRLKAEKKKVLCLKSNAQWLDIGRPDDYHAAQDIFESDPKRFLHARS
jgi:NDP-sugar pyrophosphorylase family protein